MPWGNRFCVILTCPVDLSRERNQKFLSEPPLLFDRSYQAGGRQVAELTVSTALSQASPTVPGAGPVVGRSLSAAAHEFPNFTGDKCRQPIRLAERMG